MKLKKIYPDRYKYYTGKLNIEIKQALIKDLKEDLLKLIETTKKTPYEKIYEDFIKLHYRILTISCA